MIHWNQTQAFLILDLLFSSEITTASKIYVIFI